MAVQSQCIEKFYSTLLPNGKRFSSQAALYSTAGWIGTEDGAYTKSSPVRLALLANALSVLGEESREHAMTVEGLRAYGRSMKVLARSLPVITADNGDDILTTALYLGQYEVGREPNDGEASLTCRCLRSYKELGPMGGPWPRRSDG
jgi:hypothetical protein